MVKCKLKNKTYMSDVRKSTDSVVDTKMYRIHFVVHIQETSFPFKLWIKLHAKVSNRDVYMFYP